MGQALEDFQIQVQEEADPFEIRLKDWTDYQMEVRRVMATDLCPLVWVNC